MNSDVVELTPCDREPIHTPGTIQPHGALLVVDSDTFEILQAAGDTTTLLGASVHALLGRDLETLFRPRQVRRLRILRDRGALGKRRHLLDLELIDEKSGPLDASIHRSEGFLVLEFENADLAEGLSVNPLVCVQDLIEGLDMARSLRTLCQLAAERVRSASGYDRVMVYRFMDDNLGWVFVESRQERLDPFLDLVYPAAGIPRQARALYLDSRVQLLARVDYEPAPLIPLLNPRTQLPLDMCHAILRDVSPVHREYLRSMGVNSSMSISIVSEGKLWGLIACHHYSPRRLPRCLRSVCELFGAFFSLQLEAQQRADIARDRSRAQSQESVLMAELDHRAQDTLANIQALAVQSSRSMQSLRGFTESLAHRIHAMDKAHNLLTASRWQGVSIGNLVHAELDVYGRAGADVVISGAEVVLTPQAALAMSLAIHELARNAAKYGSLSRPGGGVGVQWRIAEAGGIELSWQEAGGPLVEPSQRRGFGSNLIEQALAMETGGCATLTFNRGGVTCAVVMPASSIFRPLSERGDKTSL